MLLLSHKLKLWLFIMLLPSFDGENDWLVSTLSYFTSMAPQKVLLIFWDPAFDKDVVGINIEFIVDSVCIQSLNREMSARHSGVCWPVLLD